MPEPTGGAAQVLTADDLVAATGGTLLRRSERPVRGGAVDSRAGRARLAVRGAAWRAHRRPPIPRRGGVVGGHGAPDLAGPRSGHRRGPARRARRCDDRPRARHAARAPGRRGGVADAVRSARGRRHRLDRQDLDEGGDQRRPGRTLADAQERGQPEQRGRLAADRPAARAGARGRRPRDGHVRRRGDPRARARSAVRASAW